MAAVPSIASLTLNFQRTMSLSGSEEPATPVCRGLPRKMGQSWLVFPPETFFLSLSSAKRMAGRRRAQTMSKAVRPMEHSPKRPEFYYRFNFILYCRLIKPKQIGLSSWAGIESAGPLLGGFFGQNREDSGGDPARRRRSRQTGAFHEPDYSLTQPSRCYGSCGIQQP